MSHLSYYFVRIFVFNVPSKETLNASENGHQGCTKRAFLLRYFTGTNNQLLRHIHFLCHTRRSRPILGQIVDNGILQTEYWFWQQATTTYIGPYDVVGWCVEGFGLILCCGGVLIAGTSTCAQTPNRSSGTNTQNLCRNQYIEVPRIHQKMRK